MTFGYFGPDKQRRAKFHSDTPSFETQPYPLLVYRATLILLFLAYNYTQAQFISQIGVKNYYVHLLPLVRRAKEMGRMPLVIGRGKDGFGAAPGETLEC